MKTGNLVCCFALAGMVAIPLVGRPDGCLMPSDSAWRQHRERSLINEPDQKALIYFHNGQEQLVISPSFDGAVGSFAWVVPVPMRPQVEVLKGAPFHELARLVEPEPPLRPRIAAKSMMMESRPPVEVLERKTVGDYDVSVLASTNASALMDWLSLNHYHLPERAVTPMRSYIREGWTFVACRIKADRSANGLHTGTLTPLRLTFPVPSPIYPMRLSCANPAPFTLLAYLVIPQTRAYGPAAAVLPTSAPGRWAGHPMVRRATLTSRQRNAFPTLAGLSASNLDVYFLRATFQPEECNADFVWNLSTTF